MHKLTPRYEVLEFRIVPSSTYTWTGAGPNINWSTGANWQGGVAPSSASTLVFESGESQLSNVDDMPGLRARKSISVTNEVRVELCHQAQYNQYVTINDSRALSVAEMRLAGGYSIAEVAITITGSAGVGIDNQIGSNAFNNPVALGANMTCIEDAGGLTLGDRANHGVIVLIVNEGRAPSARSSPEPRLDLATTLRAEPAHPRRHTPDRQ